MTDMQLILVLFSWLIVFRWGYIIGRDEWREAFDKCMESKIRRK